MNIDQAIDTVLRNVPSGISTAGLVKLLYQPNAQISSVGQSLHVPFALGLGVSHAYTEDRVHITPFGNAQGRAIIGGLLQLGGN